MQKPFGYFNSSPEVNRLAAMIYIRYPRRLSPCFPANPALAASAY